MKRGREGSGQYTLDDTGVNSLGINIGQEVLQNHCIWKKGHRSQHKTKVMPPSAKHRSGQGMEGDVERSASRAHSALVQFRHTGGRMTAHPCPTAISTCLPSISSPGMVHLHPLPLQTTWPQTSFLQPFGAMTLLYWLSSLPLTQQDQLPPASPSTLPLSWNTVTCLGQCPGLGPTGNSLGQVLVSHQCFPMTTQRNSLGRPSFHSDTHFLRADTTFLRPGALDLASLQGIFSSGCWAETTTHMTQLAQLYW